MNSLFTFEDGATFILPARKYTSDGRPICIVDGCNAIARNRGKNFGGYSNMCPGHYYGKKSAKDGYAFIKKDYCENRDGRLGFICNCIIIDYCMLHRDHIDENHLNNDPLNVQTLCANCHGYKTKFYGNVKSGIIMNEIMNENRNKFLNLFSKFET